MAEEITPPGEYVRAELEARGWTQTDLAEILGVGFQTVSEIIQAKRRITPDTALRLAAAFGTSADYWLQLDQSYQLWQNRKTDTDLVSRRARLYGYAPIKEMVRRGWIPTTQDINELESVVLRFFGTDAIEQEPAIDFSARKSGSYAVPITPAQKAWLFRVKQLAQPLHVGRFSPTAAEKAVENLRLLLQEPKEIRHVPRILAEAGIRFLIVAPLTGLKIDGACIWLGDEPVVAMSLRFDRLDNFWFTLLHEMRHTIRRHNSIDCDLGIPGGDTIDRPDYEVEADDYATRTLIDPRALESFIARKRPLYSQRNIEAFGQVAHVHPGIIVGQLQARKELSYAGMRKLLVPIREIITATALTDGWGSVVSLSP